MSQREGDNRGGLPIAALLRAAADGELSAEQEAVLREHLAAHPEDERRIEFERQLRGACRRACAPERVAPAGLRERVRACCARAEPADRLDALAGRTRDRAFWARRAVVRFGAAAALMALVAVMWSLLGRGDGPVGPEVMIRRVADFARGEHGRCEGMSREGGTKFTVVERAGLEPEFAQLAGREVSLGTVLGAEDHGLRFVDAGRCHVPGGGTAMHIRFSTNDPSDGLVSLWAVLDGSLELDEGKTYLAGDGCDCVRLWRIGEVRYILVCSNADRGSDVGEAFACPRAGVPCGGP